jgi:hypothetical protein
MPGAVSGVSAPVNSIFALKLSDNATKRSHKLLPVVLLGISALWQHFRWTKVSIYTWSASSAPLFGGSISGKISAMKQSDKLLPVGF